MRSAVLACSEEGAIGLEGRLPWSFRRDFRWFREKTLGSTVVMGRKTWDSIAGPLPGRRNVVVSRTPSAHIDWIADCKTNTSVEWRTADDLPQPHICIGGAKLLAALPPPDSLHLTVVCEWTGPADTFLPQSFLDLRNYELTHCETLIDRDRTTGHFHFLTFSTFHHTNAQ